MIGLRLAFQPLDHDLLFGLGRFAGVDGEAMQLPVQCPLTHDSPVKSSNVGWLLIWDSPPIPPQLRSPEADSVDGAVLSEISRDEALDSADRAYLTAVLKKHGGVIASAAPQAGLSRQGLNKSLKRHGIEAEGFR